MSAFHMNCKGAFQLCNLELSFDADEPVTFTCDPINYFSAKHSLVNSWLGTWDRRCSTC